MGYSEDGYAGDVDAAAAAVAGGAVLAAAAVAAAASSGQTAEAGQAMGRANTGGTTWGVASSSTSSFEPPDSGFSSTSPFDSTGVTRKPLSGGGLMGWIGRLWASMRGLGVDAPEPAGTPTEILSARAQEAYAIHRSFCDQSTAYVADAFGYGELSDKSANEQVAYLESRWTRLDGEAAQELANRGGLVIAGLAQASGIGHTAVVTPGAGWRDADGMFYPNVTNGGSPAVQSDGSRTASDIWSPRDRTKVRYYTPRPARPNSSI